MTKENQDKILCLLGHAIIGKSPVQRHRTASRPGKVWEHMM